MKTQNNVPSTRVDNRGLTRPFDLLQNQIDRVFNEFSRGFGMPMPLWGEGAGMWDNGTLLPSIDMHEVDGKLMITTDLPGVAESDIDIAVQDDILTISGEKKSEFEEKAGEQIRTERSFGKFSRSVSLPFAVDPDKVDARFTNGVLKLVIDRPAEAQHTLKKIPIRH
jgi:HSP20 family protein